MKTAYGLPKKREEVLQALQGAFTQGQLDELEYERRVAQAYESKSIEDLEEVLSDFPPAIRSQVFPGRALSKSFQQQSTPPAQSTGWFDVFQRKTTDYQYHPGLGEQSLRVVMGEEIFRIAAVEERPIIASNLLGEQFLDFRESAVAAQGITIRVECYLGATQVNLLNQQFAGQHINLYINGGLGEVKISVPQSVQLVRSVQLIAGEFVFKNRQPGIKEYFTKKKNDAFPDFPLSLTIYGTFFLGTIKVVRY